MATQQSIIIIDKQKFTKGFIDDKYLRLIKLMFGIEPLVVEVELPRWWFYGPEGVAEMHAEGEDEMDDEILKERSDLDLDNIEEYMRSEAFAEFVFKGFVEALESAAPYSIDESMVKLIVLEAGWEFTEHVSKAFARTFTNATVCDAEGELASWPYNIYLGELNLHEITRRALRKGGFYRLGDLGDFTASELLEMPEISTPSIAEVKAILARYKRGLEPA